MSAIPSSSSTGVLYADGRPLSIEVAQQAAEWLTVLMQEDVSAEEKREWLAWRQAHGDHERAWQHIERVSGNFRNLDAQAGRSALGRKHVTRRTSLKTLAWLLFIGATGWTGLKTTPVRAVLADLSTGVGTRRETTLADGSLLQLNSNSAVNIRYTSTQRLLQLVKGELFVATAAEQGSAYRPFLVDTEHGEAWALGTRYAVRLDGDATVVAVEEGAVRLVPRRGQPLVLQAGQTARMHADGVEPAQAVSEQTWAWRRGQILADGMRLQDFLNELSRYRHGFVGCDDSVADLRISGVFPVDDTDEVLRSLGHSLPLQVRFINRYWVNVEPLPAS